MEKLVFLALSMLEALKSCLVQAFRLRAAGKSPFFVPDASSPEFAAARLCQQPIQGRYIPEWGTYLPRFFRGDTTMKRSDTLFSRRAARVAAEDQILEMASLKPATVAGALVQHPDIFRELNDDMARTLVLSLIDRGQAETLRRILGLKSIGRRKAALLAELLLRNAFRE
jgi:hypothetical protein